MEKVAENWVQRRLGKCVTDARYEYVVVIDNVYSCTLQQVHLVYACFLPLSVACGGCTFHVTALRAKHQNVLFYIGER